MSGEESKPISLSLQPCAANKDTDTDADTGTDAIDNKFVKLKIFGFRHRNKRIKKQNSEKQLKPHPCKRIDEQEMHLKTLDRCK